MPTRKIVPRADNEGGIGTALKRWATAFIAAITCTTINALTLAAAAVGFTIAGGTTSKTLTVTQNTALDEAVAMSSKLTIPAAWTTPAYNAGDFTGNGAMTWTVEAADVSTFAYTILGKIMLISLRLVATTIGGTLNTQLLIKIPAGKTATKIMYNHTALCEDNGVIKEAYFVVAAGTTIAVIKSDGANWTASTNNTNIMGQIMFEIN